MLKPVKVPFMKCKEILTKHVSPILDFDSFIQYFTILWSKLSEEMDVYLKREDVIMRIGEKNIWDVIRFTIKGSTSILLAIEYISNYEYNEEVERIKQNWKRSDWDSSLLISPYLDPVTYFEILEICMYNIYQISSQFKSLYKNIIEGGVLNLEVNLPREDIISLFSTSHKYIKNVIAVPKYGEDSFRDIKRISKFIEDADKDQTKTDEWKIAELSFTERIIEYISGKQNSRYLDSGREDKLAILYGNGDDYVQETFIRDIRYDGDIFSYKFDLFRLMLSYELHVYYYDGNTGIGNGVAEMVDISIQYEMLDEYFDKLNINAMLPIANAPNYNGNYKYRYIKNKLDFPLVALEYNIDDMVSVLNENGKNEKSDKRCIRLRDLVKLKCMSEDEYILPEFNQNFIEACGYVPQVLNEYTCEKDLGVKWGDCIDEYDGKNLTKNDLIEIFHTYMDQSVSIDLLKMIKKNYLCYIYNKFNKWLKAYSIIEDSLKLLLIQVFIILEKELEYNPRIIDHVVDLPPNLLEVIFFRNVFVDFDFRDFMCDIRDEYLSDRLRFTYVNINENIDKFYSQSIEGIYISGGTAYQLYYNWLGLYYDVSNIEPPARSFDLDSYLYARIPYEKLLDDEYIEYIVSSIYKDIYLLDEEVLRINSLSERFEIVNKALIPDINTKWYWKYLSNLNIPNERNININSNYTYFSIEERDYQSAIIVRLNLIIYDRLHDFYRSEHLIELIINSVSELPNLQENTDWMYFNTLKFRHPSILFEENSNSMNDRYHSGNFKWIFDCNRLLFLCNVQENTQEHFISDMEQCNFLLRISSEIERTLEIQKYIVSDLNASN